MGIDDAVMMDLAAVPKAWPRPDSDGRSGTASTWPWYEE